MERGLIWQAIKSDDLTLVKELIKQGVDINSSGTDSVKMIQRFAESRDLQNLKQNENLVPLIGKELDDLSDTKGSFNRSPVETAIQYGRTEIVQVLLEAGAKLDMEYLASLHFRTLTEEKKEIWTIMCKWRPVESVCVMALKCGQEEIMWQSLFSNLLQQEKVEVLICFCRMNAVKTVEWLLHNKFFCCSEIKEVLSNVLSSSNRVHGTTIVECLLTQDILLSENDGDLLIAGLQLGQTELVKNFLQHVPCLHLWSKDLCREIILVAMKSDNCALLEELVKHMDSGIINSICLSSIVDICRKDSNGITLLYKIDNLLKNGYLIVEWDYLNLFETLAMRKRYEQLKSLLGRLPLSTALRNRDHFLKIAIKTQNIELVKKLKMICENNGGKNIFKEYHGFGKVQDIHKNWHKVRHFRHLDKKQNRHVWHLKRNNYTKQVKSPFHLAVRTGHLELVKLFSGEKPSVVVLCDAVPHTQVLEYLLAHLDKVSDNLKKKVICKAANCNKNALALLLKSCKWQCQTELDKILHLALRCKKGDTAMLLLKHNAKLWDENKAHLVDLATDNVEVLSFVIQQGMIAVDEQTCKGLPLLIHTCLQENIEAAEFLLSHGASPNIAFQELTPLHVAVLLNNTDLVKFLLKHPQIDVSQSVDNCFGCLETRKDVTALDISLYKGNTQIHTKILESMKMNSASPLNGNSWAQKVLEITEKLLQRCQHLSDSEMSEIAALMAGTEDQTISLDISHLSGIIPACIHKDLIYYIEFLLQYGFKANDDACYEYIMVAQSHGSLEMMHVLLKYLPLDSLKESKISKSILQQLISRFAISKRKELVQDCIYEKVLLKKVLQLILDKGVDLHIKNGDDETALCCAARKGDYDICQFLIEKGYHSAELVEQDAEQCKSALTCAVLDCDLTIVQLMAKSGFFKGFNDFIMHELCRRFLQKTNSASETLDMIKYLLDLGIYPDGSCETGITPLHIAVYGNNLPLVDTFICLYDNDDKCDLEGVVCDLEMYELFNSSTALQLAVKCGLFQMALVLLEEGCAPFVQDNQNNSLLHLLCSANFNKHSESDCKKRVELIEKLLSCGISINDPNIEGMTALLCAAVNNDAMLTQILLDKGGQCDTALPQSNLKYPGFTALHIACQNCEYIIIDILLKAGASTLKRDARNRTPLHHVCKSRATNGKERPQYEIVQHLMHAGAEVNVQDLDGNHPVDNAVYSELFGIVHFLLSHNHVDDVFYKVIQNILKSSNNGEKWEKIIESLFKNGGDSKIRNIIGQSHKHASAGDDISSMCVASGKLSLYNTIITLEKVKEMMNLTAESHLLVLTGSRSVNVTLLYYILERGADVNEANNEGRTPAHVACEHDRLQVLEILFKYGADVNVQDKYGWTPIHVCVNNMSSKCLTFLLGHSECVNLTTTAKYGSTFAGSTALVMSIIQYGAESNLHQMYFENSTRDFEAKDNPLMNLLLKHGANPNITDINGNNAFHIAVARELPINLLDRLVKRIRDINVRNEKCHSALHMALIGNVDSVEEEMIEFLLQKRCNPNLPMPPQLNVKEGDTVLHLAVRGRRRDLVQVLLFQGSDLLVKNSVGESPVSLCFGKDNQLPLNNICLLDLLLKAGASLPCLNITTHFKFMRITQQLLRLLLECGCRVRVDVSLAESDATTEEQGALLNMIHDCEGNPLPLELLSANTVRQVLKPNALYGVDKLPVPTPIRDIIVMEHISCVLVNNGECCVDISDDSASSVTNTSDSSEYSNTITSVDFSTDSSNIDSSTDSYVGINDYVNYKYLFDLEEKLCYNIPDNPKMAKSRNLHPEKE